jgi:hypothetical protein
MQWAYNSNMAKQIEKRKTYSLHPERSRELSRLTLDISDALSKTIPKQDVLDALVGILSDKVVLNKVLAKLETQ